MCLFLTRSVVLVLDEALIDRGVVVGEPSARHRRLIQVLADLRKDVPQS